MVIYPPTNYKKALPSRGRKKESKREENEEGLRLALFPNYCTEKYRAILFNLVLYSVLFNFGHIRRWDQCAVYILYYYSFKIFPRF